MSHMHLHKYCTHLVLKTMLRKLTRSSTMSSLSSSLSHASPCPSLSKSSWPELGRVGQLSCKDHQRFLSHTCFINHVKDPQKPSDDKSFLYSWRARILCFRYCFFLGFLLRHGDVLQIAVLVFLRGLSWHNQAIIHHRRRMMSLFRLCPVLFYKLRRLKDIKYTIPKGITHGKHSAKSKHSFI